MATKSKTNNKTKNIIVIVVWTILTAFSIFIFYQSYILSTYTKTPIKITSSSVINYSSIPQGDKSATYRYSATYTASNGNTYPISFTSLYTTVGTLSVYYKPTNPAVYKISSTQPAVIGIIPVGVAGLVTFLVYSNITFFPKSKKKS